MPKQLWPDTAHKAAWRASTTTPALATPFIPSAMPMRTIPFGGESTAFSESIFGKDGIKLDAVLRSQSSMDELDEGSFGNRPRCRDRAAAQSKKKSKPANKKKLEEHRLNLQRLPKIWMARSRPLRSAFWAFLCSSVQVAVQLYKSLRAYVGISR